MLDDETCHTFDTFQISRSPMFMYMYKVLQKRVTSLFLSAHKAVYNAAIFIAVTSVRLSVRL